MQLINLGISPSTAKVYDAGKKAYLKFCARFNFTPIPAQEEVLILFVTELSQTLVHNSVRTYLAGVRHFHVVSSAGNPLQDKLRLQLALAGIRRWKPKAGGTRLPMTPLVLRTIKKVFDATSTDYQNILLWGACCVGFFGFMRSGEFTTSTTAFNPSCHLSIQDVAIDSHSNPTLVQLHLKLINSAKEHLSTYPEQAQIYVRFLLCLHTSQFVEMRRAPCLSIKIDLLSLSKN